MTPQLGEAWNALRADRDRLAQTDIKTLFADDADRFARFSAVHDDLLLDFSKHRIDARGLDTLVGLARACALETRRDDLLAGKPVNNTEGRPALHTALRAPRDASVLVDGRNIMPDVHAVLDSMEAFADRIRAGETCGASGEPFTDVVNIGIGGSDLGPAMATQALEPYRHERLAFHFVSNVDGAHIHDTLKALNPERTLFLVASKSFTTLETMANAAAARGWIEQTLGPDAIKHHFVAISTNHAEIEKFGIAGNRVFGFWDWVGGRYSVWSAIGLSVMLAVGPPTFRAFLAGAHAMDRHFATEPLERNMPVLMGLLGVWYREAWQYASHAILPYDQRLARFAAHFQQVEMESNGKRVTRDGAPVAHATCPVIWGEPGTNAQHSFFQLLHQGTDIVPVDFLIAAEPHESVGDQHAMLVANGLAQASALMNGRTLQEATDQLTAGGMTPEAAATLAPHRVFPGNRPSTTLLYRRLDPATLGKLIALYEHKVFVQGVLWDINSFDQWGVELGKEMSADLLPRVQAGSAADLRGLDGSTAGLLAHRAALIQ